MAPLVELRNLHKKFAAVHALSNINLDINAGEVLAVVGENGAGKSTLIKVLCGIIEPDEGEIIFDGKQVDKLNPWKTKELGIRAVQQHFSLIPTMSVAENIYYDALNDYKKKQLLSWRTIEKECNAFLKSIGYDDINAGSLINSLSVADCQRVEVAKAIRDKAKLLIFDEPSAVLPVTDVDNLFRIINKLKSEGAAVVYISHHLDEVFSIADKIAVLKDGELVTVINEPKSIDNFGLIRLMVGREVNDIYPTRNIPPVEETVLSLKNISTKHVSNISFDVHKGEILGIAGLVGAGRTELCRAIFGMDPILSGDMFLNSAPFVPTHPADAIKQGVGFVTEDRHHDGLILNETVANNISFVGLKRLVERRLISNKTKETMANKYVDALNIKVSSTSQEVYSLSGGNQQKVVLAKWLFIEPNVLLLDEATRGIDVNAKREIYILINELASSGVAIILVSSELQEILQLSHKILVMREGQIVSKLDYAEATEEIIIAKASGL